MAFRRWFPSKQTRAESRRSRRAARKLGALARLSNVRMEPLEDRQLLTTIVGGESFEYFDDRQQVIRIRLDGNISAEIIGSVVDPFTNAVTLGPLRGNLTHADGTVDPIAGGLVQTSALQLFCSLGTITDPNTGVINNEIIGNIAANNTGQLYAVGTHIVGTATVVDVIQFTLPPVGGTGGILNGTVVASFAGATLGVTTVNASDFDPGSGNLFFVGNSGDGTPDILFSIDVSLGSRGAREGSLNTVGTFAEPTTGNPPAPQPVTVTGITFTGAGQFTGVATIDQNAGPGGGGGGGGGNNTIIFNGNVGNLIIGNNTINVLPQAQQGGGGGGGQTTPATNIGSIEAAPGGGFIAVGFGADGQVLQVQPNNNAVNLGPINTNPAAGTPGQAITGLTFIPNLPDPFTDRVGAFVAFDSQSRSFFFVDTRNQAPAQNLWSLYISQSDVNASVAAGFVRNLGDTTTPPGIKGTQGNSGDIRVLPAQGGLPILVNSGDETGQAFLGARTLDINQNDPFDDLRPVVTAQNVPADVDFGALPPSFTTLRPGVYMAPGNDLGKFLWGGTITGVVDLRGSIDTFYCGWLLTGDARGLAEGAASSSPLGADSFRVDGDIRNLIVKDSIGTNDDFPTDLPVYVTGFDMQVNGTLGQINTEDTFVGNLEVAHLSTAPSLTNNQRETETHQSGAVTDGVGLFDRFLLGGPANDNVAAVFPAAAGATNSFYNDSFWTAQRLNTFTSSELNRGGVVRVDGVLQDSNAFLTNGVANPDPVDYYALPLMAGQTIVVKLDSALPGLLQTGVFDPDGRIVATDLTQSGLATNEAFRFTADRPGLYRFAVGNSGDAGNSVDGNPAFTTATTLVGVVPYTLNITNAGDVALGAVTANRTIFDLPGKTGFRVLRGDFGALETVAPALAPAARGVATDSSRVGRIVSDNVIGVSTIVVDGGNLRAIDAGYVGEIFGTGNTLTETLPAVVLDVPNGSVGHIRSRSGAPAAAGAGDYGGISIGNPIDQTRASGHRAIGGEYQLIDAPRGIVYVDIAANRGLGVLRARTMATLTASAITLNADNNGRDGILDLIDVAEDFGILGAGGPAITTNEGGNVRYIRVLGTVFQDAFFGGGLPTETVIEPGQDFSLTDDSGAVVKLRPLAPAVRNPNFDPQNPNGATAFLGTSMIVTAYGIRGSGGSAIVDVTALTTSNTNIIINSANPNALATDPDGIEISASGDAPAEIGRIEVTGNGTPVTFSNVAAVNSPLPVQPPIVITGPDGRTRVVGFGAGRTVLGLGLVNTTDNPLRPLEVRITGDSTVDVLNVVVTGPDLSTLGSATLISNNTPDGEIANVTAQSIGRLFSRGTIGMTKSHSGTAVEGIEDLVIGNSLLADTSNALGGADGGTVIGTGSTVRLQRQVYPTRSVTFGSPAANDKQFVSNVRNGIVVVGGNVGEIASNEGVANVFVQGSIGTINANADGVDKPGVLDGIRGPIATFSFTNATQPAQAGRILSVNIGEGIGYGGNGDFVRAGILAYTTIGPITGDVGADIRGPIHSNGFTTVGPVNNLGDASLIETPATAATRTTQDGVFIQSITLRDGSIINTSIMSTVARGDVLPLNGAVLIEERVTDTLKNPLYDIGTITLSGSGGMIGTLVEAADIGKVTVDDAGFGVIDCTFSVLGDGRFLGVNAGGYGIRGSSFAGGASTSNLIARGDGSSKSTASVSPSVRLSEGVVPDDALFLPIAGETPVDPYSGQAFSTRSDIHSYLGTSAAQPEIAGRTDTGIIEAVDARGSRDLDYVSAWQIRADPAGTNTLFNFANSIGTVVTQDVINGLTLTTGSIKSFNPRADVFRLDMTVAGTLKKLTINGNLRDNSVIRTQGRAGTLGTITVNGDLEGTLQSSQSIKKLVVGRNFTGKVSAANAGKSAIGTLQVNGALTGSSLQVDGNVGKLIAGQFGTSIGDKLTVNGSVGAISVLGDMRASLAVSGSLKSLTVRGSVFSGGLNPGLTIDIGDQFGALTVGGDVEQGVIVTPQPKKLNVGGQFAGTFA